LQDQGLNVYLKHTAPAGSSVFTGDANEVYIEAVDGERFNILKKFDIKDSTHLRVKYQVG
jgi:hypothetical protein